MTTSTPHFCFAPVLRPITISCDAPVQLTSTLVLRRPSNEEIGMIVGAIERYVAEPFMRDVVKSYFEGDFNEERLVRVEPSKWRYAIVEFLGWKPELTFHANDEISQFHQLQTVSNLTDCHLPLCTAIHSVDRQGDRIAGIESVGFWSGDPFNRVISDRKPNVFSDKSAIQIRDVFKLVEELSKSGNKACQKVLRAMGTFNGLLELGRANQFYAIGIFSIIESLIAVQPQFNTEKITRQIQKKMALLNRLFDSPLDYGAFGGATSDEVWKSLYTYRSQLAHGDLPNFDDTKLRLLLDANTALNFLDETARTLVFYAMKNPVFVSDLQDC